MSFHVSGYINAGGRGTRLNGVFSPDPQFGISKALLPVGNPPITLIEHHINKLLRAGLCKIVVGVGDHDHVAMFIKRHYRNHPAVIPIVVPRQLGNGGDLIRAVRSLPGGFAEHVLIVNVDSVVDIDE